MSEKVNLKEILSVSGQSSLFKFVGKTKNGLVVEDINSKQRTAFGESAKVSSLQDIAVYTDTEEITLKNLLKIITSKENKNPVQIDTKKTTNDIIKNYFSKVLPNYDRDRLYVSHMKKIIDWYNQLQRNNMLDFDNETETQVEEKDEQKN